MSTPFYQTVSSIADQRLADQRLDLFGDDLTAGLFDVDHADYTFEGCESQNANVVPEGPAFRKGAVCTSDS